MEPELHREPFPSDRHIFQVKWDGVRMLVFSSRGDYRLQGRRLKDKTRVYPELSGLPRELSAREAILDGEMVVMINGKPSFAAILQRERTTTVDLIGRMARLNPIQYMIFDLLWLDGEDLRLQPLIARQEKLAKILPHQQLVLPGGATLNLVEDFEDGPGLFRAVDEQGLEGIVAKVKDSPYLTGGKSRLWLKIKCRRRQLCVVGGFTLRDERFSALLLGVYTNEGLFYVGRAGSGLNGRELQLLTEWLPRLTRDQSPFCNPVERGLQSNWVEPQLVALVEFMEWTEAMHLRSPVIKGFTGDEPARCVFD